MRLEEPGPEEMAVMRRVSGLHLDHLALAVMSNIWRTAQAFKQEMERTVLRASDLSFAAFSTLFIVWVWGPIETRAISRSQGVTRATVTSTVTLLEGRGLVTRHEHEADRRLVLVSLTKKGRAVIERLFPRFNRAEGHIASSLSKKEQETLAHLLRKLFAGTRSADRPRANGGPRRA